MEPEEQIKHFKEGRCFTCHEVGHLARNCPKKGTMSKTYVKKVSSEEEGKEVTEQDFAQD